MWTQILVDHGGLLMEKRSSPSRRGRVHLFVSNSQGCECTRVRVLSRPKSPDFCG